MNFSFSEAINLIIRYYTFPCGHWVEIKPELAEDHKFITSQYVSLDSETKSKYILNEQGDAFLRVYVQEIAKNFIEFMKENGCECSAEKVINWFVATYDLSDNVIGKDICDYICENLERYGYSARIPNPARKEDTYKIQPYSMKTSLR